MVYYTNVARGLADLKTLKPIALDLSKAFVVARTGPISFDPDAPPSNAAYNRAKEVVKKAQDDLKKTSREELVNAYDVAQKALERVLFLRTLEGALFAKATKESIAETGCDFIALADVFLDNAIKIRQNQEKEMQKTQTVFLEQIKQKHLQVHHTRRRIKTDFESYLRYNRFISDEDCDYYAKIWQAPTDPELAYGEHLCSLGGLFFEAAIISASKVESCVDTVRMVDSVLFAHNEPERMAWNATKTAMLATARPYAKQIPGLIAMAQDHYTVALNYCAE